MLHSSYETYLVDDELGDELALRFVSVPTRLLGRGLALFPGPFNIRSHTDPPTFEEAARALGLRVSERLTPTQVPAALVTTLESRMPVGFGGSGPESPIHVFTTRAAMEPFVPMENSPWKLSHSLAS